MSTVIEKEKEGVGESQQREEGTPSRGVEGRDPWPRCSVGRPCLTGPLFIALDNCYILYKMQARPPTSKKIKARLMAVEQTPDISEVCLSGCGAGEG